LKKTLLGEKTMKLGAQFFSIRTKTQTPEDLRLSFKAMKEIGYEIAQMSAICKMDPYQLRDFSQEFDMPITCTHSPLDRIINDTDALIKEHQIYGCPTIGLGWLDNKYERTIEGVSRFLSDIREPVKKIKAAGMNFSYHNHDIEFVKDGGTTLYDYMIENAPDMTFIVDTYWMKFAGYEFLDYVKKLGKERVTDVHFKDMKTEPKGSICPCGEGVIDFKPLITLCDNLGIENALVEQDNAPDSGDDWGQMAISYKNLKPLF
jgi:sugar phosphate isomerase/epimerase